MLVAAGEPAPRRGDANADSAARAHNGGTLMTTSDAPDSASRPLLGMGVVPGSGYGPAIRPAPRPELPSGGERVPEDEREAEIARYTEAVTDVSGRL